MNTITKRSGTVAGVVAGAVVAVLATAASSAAERIEFPLAQVRLITSDAGAARILLAPGDISVLDGELVTSAFLRIPLAGNVPKADLDVVVYALDTAWAGQDARWNTPWSRPGGDLDATYAHTVRLGRERAGGHFSPVRCAAAASRAAAIHRVLRVARTIADLDGVADVRLADLAEAVRYRILSDGASGDAAVSSRTAAR